MKFNQLVENVAHLFSVHDNLEIYGAHVAGGKTLKSIEKSLEELAKDKKVLYLSTDEKPLPLYIKFIEVAKMLAEENPEYAKFTQGELSRTRNLIVTELNVGMSVSEELKFVPVINYDTIKRQIAEFKPDLVVVDHYEGDTAETEKFASMLKEVKTRGLITRQLNKNMIL